MWRLVELQRSIWIREQRGGFIGKRIVGDEHIGISFGVSGKRIGFGFGGIGERGGKQRSSEQRRGQSG